jgi:hypothetical protein
LTNHVSEFGNVAFYITIVVGEIEVAEEFAEVVMGDSLNVGNPPEAEELNTPPKFTADRYSLFVPIGYSRITFTLP